MARKIDMVAALESIVTAVSKDPGLNAQTSDADIAGGLAAAREMNDLYAGIINARGWNDDGVLTPQEVIALTQAVRANPTAYQTFLDAHGNDEGGVETGFHLVQGDGGTLKFKGRKFVDTVADAIYHIGFAIQGGRFRNEDGDQNEKVTDVAGWLNYFLNGQSRVFGTNASETLHSGDYSPIFVGAEHEVYHAGGGNDKIWAGDGHDKIFAGNGNDKSGGGTGSDKMYGQSGDDRLYGEEGADIMFGGAGRDELGGGKHSDIMHGGAQADKLWGDDGNDRMFGGSGADILGAGRGDDFLVGNAGNDTLWAGDGHDKLFGGNGNDRMGGGKGSDTMFGGAGNDTISTDGGADKVYGGDGHDTVWGSNQTNILDGGAGDDNLSGKEGNDSLFGGDGHDTLRGGDDHDQVYGGWGRDRLTGNDGHDRLYGGAGRDSITGEAGADIMFGGAGDDVMACSAGRDTFIGGRGADTMSAFESVQVKDTFIFNPGDSGKTHATKDVIKGFKSGVDKLDFSAFDGLVYIGNASHFGGGQATIRFDGDHIKIDRNGDGTTDEMIEMMYLSELQQGDFIL